MQISTTFTDHLPQRDTAIALGFFDGLHRGHQAVIERALAQRVGGLSPCVFTFTLSPGAGKAREGLIQTEATKERVLEGMGVEQVFCPPFALFQELSPREFVEEMLIGRFRARFLACGENFRFGKGAVAGPRELQALCAPHGVRVEVVPVVLCEGEPISSTRIRGALEAGEMEEVARLLGHPYTLVAPVSHGAKLGRTISCPTTNQYFAPGQLIPKNGVYATLSQIDGETYIGATNVGRKPTVDGKEVLAETYLVGFDRQVYGQMVTVEFYHFLRAEEKFPSLSALSDAIHKSADQAVALLQKYLDK